jgi:hypothetical protein
MKDGDRVIVKTYGRKSIWLNGVVQNTSTGMGHIYVKDPFGVFLCDLGSDNIKPVIRRTWATNLTDILRQGIY